MASPGERRHPPSSAGARTTKVPLQRVDVRALLGHGREAVLVHQGEEYRLRLTSKGKLILTK